MQIGVLGGRDNIISNMEGYVYLLSIILMIGYMRREEKKERYEGWEMEVEVVLLSIMGMVLLI